MEAILSKKLRLYETGGTNLSSHGPEILKKTSALVQKVGCLFFARSLMREHRERRRMTAEKMSARDPL